MCGYGISSGGGDGGSGGGQDYGCNTEVRAGCGAEPEPVPTTAATRLVVTHSLPLRQMRRTPGAEPALFSVSHIQNLIVLAACLAPLRSPPPHRSTTVITTTTAQPQHRLRLMARCSQTAAPQPHCSKARMSCRHWDLPRLILPPTQHPRTRGLRCPARGWACRSWLLLACHGCRRPPPPQHPHLAAAAVCSRDSLTQRWCQQ